MSYADVAWIRRKADMYGEHALSRNERHRLQAGEDEERQKAHRAEAERAARAQHAQLEHDTLVQAMDQWTTWLRGELEAFRGEVATLRADMVEADTALGGINSDLEREVAQRDETILQLKSEIAVLKGEANDRIAELRRSVEAVCENITRRDETLQKVLDKEFDRLDEQDKTIATLRTEISDFRTKQAGARVEDLNTLHASLVRSAELSMKAFEQAAQRAELSTNEFEQVAKVAAKANELSVELQRLREAQKNFRFAREERDGGDFGIVDLPAGYLSSPRKH